MRRALREMTSLLTVPEVPDDITALAGTCFYRFFACMRRDEISKRKAKSAHH